MNRVYSHLEQIDIIGKLADLKEHHYHNTLLLAALVELLTEKGLLQPEDIHARTAELDKLTPPTAHPIS